MTDNALDCVAMTLTDNNAQETASAVFSHLQMPKDKPKEQLAVMRNITGAKFLERVLVAVAPNHNMATGALYAWVDEEGLLHPTKHWWIMGAYPRPINAAGVVFTGGVDQEGNTQSVPEWFTAGNHTWFRMGGIRRLLLQGVYSDEIHWSLPGTGRYS